MLPTLKRALAELVKGGSLTLSHVPDGYDALVSAHLAEGLAAPGEERAVALVHVARDSQRAAAFGEALSFAAPQVEVLDFPAWDCQPYDRASPNPSICARRMTVLSRLARSRSSRERPRILSTTVNALVQRVPPLETVAADSFSAAPGNMVRMDDLVLWLATNGFARTSTVQEAGDYALRGGILDLFAPGQPLPVRLDFFGDTLESIRTFDVESQRSVGQLRALDLVPVSEVPLTTESMRRFRMAYLAAFDGQTRGDSLYESVSEGRRHAGMEHWMPLFHERVDTLLDYVKGAPLLLDAQVDHALSERFSQISDYYQARKTAYDRDPARSPYKPLAPDALYFAPDELKLSLARASVARFVPFDEALETKGLVVDCGARPGRSFAPERLKEDTNVFEAAVTHIHALQEDGRRVIVAGWSEGSRERLGHVLEEHGLQFLKPVSSLPQALGVPAPGVPLVVLGVEQGFETDAFVIIGEQDILGDRLIRQRKKPRRAEDFLREVTALSAGDLVVHVDHGIGRFVGLKTIEAMGAPHDCLELHYAGGDKLFLPVENLELLSRYGSEDTEAQLDRLGGAGWQARKSKMRQRIREMAHALIKIAAARMLREAPRLLPPESAYEEFCARFPYDETEDQASAIQAVLDDLGKGRPMDRLVCGDVGFGKTEVALRAAFSVALNGRQVAVVVPTTLLARQHYRNFTARFAGLPVKIAQMSRMVSAADLKVAKAGAQSGDIDIVIGTHAVLGKAVGFRDLGLVIIDEEQHFGVAHKERLKELRAEVHVLTLSATPIPRTLQLALTGVRELSIIATPPVDRLAVRTSIAPFDALMVREALLRERFRGGQSFYVCPRIDDIEECAAFLRSEVPEVKYVIAHGQMPATELEEKMSAFYDGQYDVLLSTAIVESGLDIPTANTMIVHRADMFGLGQLYQLRGRVGRSKTRAYALFTLPTKKPMTPQAEKRLNVLKSLDTLGAGFQLASHDLDIRGAGNLLGDEQSGHIREVGYELYQQMLNDAIEALKAGITEPVEEAWSPQITIGTPVTIPEDYMPDLSLRLSFYKRLSVLGDDGEIQGVAAEMIDRFGPMPEEVEQLMRLVAIKALCRRAHVEKVDAGPKGVIVAFKDNSFANPAGLVRYVGEYGDKAKVRPDMKIVFMRDFKTSKDRLEGTKRILTTLALLAEKKAVA